MEAIVEGLIERDFPQGETQADGNNTHHIIEPAMIRCACVFHPGVCSLALNIGYCLYFAPVACGSSLTVKMMEIIPMQCG